MWLLKNRGEQKIPWGEWFWWLGFPLINFFIIWGPYWIWNIVYDQPLWWRIPMIYGSIFDTPTYLQWIGQAILGLEAGRPLSWFAVLVRVLHYFFPQGSVSEIWLITRWFTTTSCLWIVAWCLARWAGLGRWPARFFALSFWLSLVLVLGMRPGVFSWYLPFGFLGMTATALVLAALEKKQFYAAIAWSLAALIAASVYSWFLFFVGLWLVTVWLSQLINYSRKFFLALWIFGSCLIATCLPFILIWVIPTVRWSLLIDSLERFGLAYARLPLISNSFLAMLGWLGLVFYLNNKKLESIQWAWIALLLSWLMTPFTGVYIHNDHFRTPVVMLSWISLAIVWSYLSEGATLFSEQGTWVRRWLYYLPNAILGLSAFFIVNILRQPYAFNNDFLNVLHFSHWFALAVGSWLIIRRRSNLKHPAPKIFFGGLLLGSLLIGGVAGIAALKLEFFVLATQQKYQPAIDWINFNVPATETICTDKDTADVLAAHTGRLIYPAETTFYLTEPSQDVFQRIILLAGVYDFFGAGQGETLRYLSKIYIGIACGQFSRQVQWLSRLGLSETRIDLLRGCASQDIEQRIAQAVAAAEEKKFDPIQFRLTCHWIVVPEERRLYWNIPAEYLEFKLVRQILIFGRPN